MIILHDARCVEYSAPGHPERPARIARTVPLLQERHPNWEWKKPNSAEEAALLRAHSREHIAQIFRNNPDIQFSGRRLYVHDGLVVNEWTATASRDGKTFEWDGIDVFPIEDGLIKRKDVYSGFGVAREVG